MLRMAAGLQGGEGGGKSYSEAKHEHTPQGLDWQEFWTQDVRSGVEQLVSEDHTLTDEPLNPQKDLGTSLSLPRAFSSLWHK